MLAVGYIFWRPICRADNIYVKRMNLTYSTKYNIAAYKKYQIDLLSSHELPQPILRCKTQYIISKA